MNYKDVHLFVHQYKDLWFEQKDIENIMYKYWNLFYWFIKQLIACLKGLDLLY